MMLQREVQALKQVRKATISNKFLKIKRKSENFHQGNDQLTQPPASIFITEINDATYQLIPVQCSNNLMVPLRLNNLELKPPPSYEEAVRLAA